MHKQYLSHAIDTYMPNFKGDIVHILRTIRYQCKNNYLKNNLNYIGYYFPYKKDRREQTEITGSTLEETYQSFLNYITSSPIGKSTYKIRMFVDKKLVDTIDILKLL